MHLQFPHGQPQPGQLLAQPFPLGVPQGERPHALGKDALRDDAAHGRAPQPRQHLTERLTQTGRSGVDRRPLRH
ncbi:hypothetical protein [Streptomyces fungicidicus]|uniref:hypothetical protein n=1 Tax=Streptomyces fungicidicus TaxID=68203 RepID=UPI003D72A8E8